MQAVSGNWNSNLASSELAPLFSTLFDFPQTIVTSNFFTIGTSLIGGPDVIKSGGTAVAFFDKYQWTDYSPYLLSQDVSQKIGQYPWGIIMAQADVTLDNSTNLFTPYYDPTIGSYMLAGRPFKWTLGFNGESLSQFVGYTTNPHIDQSNTEKSISYMAYDVFNYIATYQSTNVPGGPVLVSYRTDQIIAAGLQEMGFSSSQYVLDIGLQQPIGVFCPYGYYWGDLFNDLCMGEQGIMFADENGIIHFWNRQHFLTTGGNVWQLDNSNIEILVSEDTPIFNDVEVFSNPRAIASDQQVWQLGTAQLLNPGSNVVEADFSDDDGSMPVSSIDTLEPYTSATSSSYQANTAIDGSGTDMTGSVSVTSIQNVGTTAFITFNNTSSQPLYLVGIGGSPGVTLYGTPGKITTPVSIRYTDAASVTAYGTNPGNSGQVLQLQAQDVDVIQDPSTASSLTYTLVHEFKDGRQRYNATVFANPAIQLGDVIQIVQQDGACLSFAGSGAGAQKTSGLTGLPHTNASWSVSVWFNIPTNELATSRCLFSLVNGTSGTALILVNGTLKVMNGSATGTTLVTGSIPSAALWHNAIYTYNGTTNSLYLDGTLLGTSTTAPAAVTPSLISFGSFSGSLEPFNGLLDTGVVWNTVLALSDVQNVFIGALGATSGIVGEWLFNEGFGNTTTADAIGGNNLTVGSNISWQPEGAFGIKTMYTTGRTLSIGVEDLTHTLELEERQIASYFTIGTSLIGGTDTIAP